MLTRILHDPLLQPGFAFLRDRRGSVSSFEVATVVAVVDAIRRFWPDIQPSRAAILISDECDPGAIAAYALADGHCLSIQTFTSYDAAVEWLRQGLELRGGPARNDRIGE